jgi:hypothetical protein
MGFVVLFAVLVFFAAVIWSSTDSGGAYFSRKLKPWRPVGRYFLADLRALRPKRRPRIQPVEVEIPDYMPDDWGY